MGPSSIELPVQINHASAATVAEQLCAQVLAQKSEARVVVDASALRKFDSSALAVLLALWRVACTQKRDWQVHAASTHLQELATLYGLDALLLA